MKLDEEGNYAKRTLGDGRVARVRALTYGRARIFVERDMDVLQGY